MDSSNGIEDRLEAAVADRVVSDEDEDVDRITRVDGLHEPLLGDHGFGRDDFGDIGIS